MGEMLQPFASAGSGRQWQTRAPKLSLALHDQVLLHEILPD